VKVHNDAGRGGVLARSLGWFSIGLGVAEIVAPRRLARVIGVDERPVLMRLLGVRECASGIAILAQDRPLESLWSRVAGDAMDLALLGRAIASQPYDKRKVVAATAAVAGVTALDVFASIQSTRARNRVSRSAITINRPRKEVFEFWRDPNNLRQIVTSLPSDFEPVGATPDEFIEWRSPDGVMVKSATVRFKQAFGRDGTEVRAVVYGMFPERLLHEVLRRAKRLIETGEVPTTEGQPAGPRTAAVVSRLIQRLEGKEVA